jgi:Single-strand binding protein family
MTAHVLITGVLFRQPESRVSKSGKPFAMATLRVSAGNESQFWRLFVFSESAQAELAKLSDGDALACQGVPKFELFRPETGEPRVSLSITVDHVLALKQPPKQRAKPHEEPAPMFGPRSRETAPEPSGFSRNGCSGDDPFGDEMPF